MGAGVILATLRPVWLAPPLLQHTPLIYLSLALAWLPVLGVCAILRPIGGWRNSVKLVILGLLVCLLWGILSGPSLGAEMLSRFRDLNCRTEQLLGSQTRYTCTSTVFLHTPPTYSKGRIGHHLCGWLRGRKEAGRVLI